MSEDEKYYVTTRENLLRDLKGPPIGECGLSEFTDQKVDRVLDIGCGIGQALLPLAVRRGAEGIGIDISEHSLRMGREFYQQYLPESKVIFLNARAESLPFETESFDLVNCSLALPYTRNAGTIAEVARVLRPGGIFLLKIHHFRYYLQELFSGLLKAKPKTMIHGGRVLTAGVIYHLLGRQPSMRWLNETFQTRWLLKRELANNGMSILKEQAGIDLAAPAFVISKSPSLIPGKH